MPLTSLPMSDALAGRLQELLPDLDLETAHGRQHALAHLVELASLRSPSADSEADTIVAAARRASRDGHHSAARHLARRSLRESAEHPRSDRVQALAHDVLARAYDAFRHEGAPQAAGLAMSHRVWANLAADRWLESGDDAEVEGLRRVLVAKLARTRELPVIFISYARASTGSFAAGLRAELVRRVPDGARRVLMDSTSFQAGHSLGEQIQRAIQMATTVVVLLDTTSIQRFWTRVEHLRLTALQRSHLAAPRVITVWMDDGEIPRMWVDHLLITRPTSAEQCAEQVLAAVSGPSVLADPEEISRSSS